MAGIRQSVWKNIADLALGLSLGAFILFDTGIYGQQDCNCRNCADEASDYYVCLIETPCADDDDVNNSNEEDRITCCCPPESFCGSRTYFVTIDATRRQLMRLQCGSVSVSDLAAFCNAAIEITPEFLNPESTDSTALLATLGLLRC